jgi:hypothetical protein
VQRLYLGLDTDDVLDVTERDFKVAQEEGEKWEKLVSGGRGGAALGTPGDEVSGRGRRACECMGARPRCSEGKSTVRAPKCNGEFVPESARSAGYVWGLLGVVGGASELRDLSFFGGWHAPCWSGKHGDGYRAEVPKTPGCTRMSLRTRGASRHRIRR